jgi:hypothetical protein
MSALGQKQTCAAQNGVSALHPKATAKADMPALVVFIAIGVRYIFGRPRLVIVNGYIGVSNQP